MAATPSSVSARPEVTICTQCGSSFNLVQCEPFGRVRADEYAAEQGRFDRYIMTVPAAANVNSRRGGAVGSWPNLHIASPAIA
jgi:hypothetical protein